MSSATSTSPGGPFLDLFTPLNAQELREEHSLQWNINRWYDPRIGPWLSEDAIGFGGGDENLRRYVGNSSVGRRDPLGLWSPPNVMDSDDPIVGERSPLQVKDGVVIAIVDFDDTREFPSIACGKDFAAVGRRHARFQLDARLDWQQLRSQIEQVFAEYGPIDRVIIADHGSSRDGITWQQFGRDGREFTYNDIRMLEQFLSKDADLVLGGCFAGTDDKYLRRLSNIIEGTVIASTDFTTIRTPAGDILGNWRIVVHPPIVYDSEDNTNPVPGIYHEPRIDFPLP